MWKKICCGIVAAILAILSPASQLFSQDSFREFDRSMVATPAELYEALSTLHPAKRRRPIDPQRLREIEKAGRDFLSKLTPEQQDKAWEYAEKYLRKNAVDAASSRKLMQEFGLPPEMQNELSKQLRKFGKRTSDPRSTFENKSDDAISQLLKQARENFENAEQGQGAEIKKASELSPNEAQPNRKLEAEIPGGNKTSQRGIEDESSRIEKQVEEPNVPPTQRKRSPKPKPRGQRSDTRPMSPFDEFKESAKVKEDNFNSDSDKNREKRTASNADRQEDNRRVNNDAELDKLMERLNGLQRKNEAPRRRGVDAGGSGDLDWERVIKDLAERPAGNRSGQSGNPLAAGEDPVTVDRESSGANEAVDPGMLGKAQDLFSKAINPKKDSDGGGGLAESMSGGSASNEKVGTRFDRLLMKAVDRTLKSENDQNSGGVSGMLGSLIEKFQESRESNNREMETGRNTRPQNSGNRGDRSSNSGSNDSFANNSSSGSNGGSAMSPKPRASRSSSSSSGSTSMPDLIPDLSGINPTQVFTFFAIVGVVLFVGYLLMQSVAGSEVALRKRAVIKKVRNTTIRSPKDLVETVDMFLLAKFGIRSSWWNAAIARHVLDSGSPDLQARVDELFRDYVRARYMQDNIQIPAADQQRYRETLEELSKLDVKPGKLSYVPTPPTTNPRVSMEG